MDRNWQRFRYVSLKRIQDINFRHSPGSQGFQMSFLQKHIGRQQ